MFSEELMMGTSVLLLLLEPPSGGILIIRALELLFKESEENERDSLRNVKLYSRENKGELHSEFGNVGERRE